MISIPILEDSQVGAARREALHLGETVGLAADDLDRLALVVTEATTNLVRHAVNGELVIDADGTSGKPSVTVFAVDDGPGIVNVEAAMVDGFTSSTTQSAGIGAGLGSMDRQADSFEIYSSPHGTTLVARIEAASSRSAKGPEVSALIVPKPGFSRSGDAWSMRRRSKSTLVMLMDVLGHGPSAADDGDRGIQAFKAHAAASLEDSEAHVADAMEGSRGAAMLMVEIPHGEGKLRALGLGNVKGDVLLPTGSRYGIPSQPGILGSSSRRPRPSEHEWAPGSILILTTDGLRTSARTPEPSSLYFRSADIIAATLYKARRRGSDDAGIVVVRSGS